MYNLDHRLQRMLNHSNIAQLISERPLHQTCDDCVNAVIGVIHTGAKSGYKLVTLFDSCYDDVVKAVLGVIHTSP